MIYALTTAEKKLKLKIYMRKNVLFYGHTLINLTCEIITF